MKRFKNLTSIVLALALMMSLMTACGKTSETTEETSTIDSIEITLESVEETEPEETDEAETTTSVEVPEETSLYDEYETSVIMYGKNPRARYWSGTGVSAVAEGYIEVNTEYEVVGESSTSYYINIDGNIYRVSKTALSTDEVEDVEDENTSETEPTEATQPTEGTTPTTAPSGNQPTTAPTTPNPTLPPVTIYCCDRCELQFYSQADLNTHMRLEHSGTTPAPTNTPRPTTAPATPTPTPRPANVCPYPAREYAMANVTVTVDLRDGTSCEATYNVEVVRNNVVDDGNGGWYLGSWAVSTAGDSNLANYITRDFSEVGGGCYHFSNAYNITLTTAPYTK